MESDASDVALEELRDLESAFLEIATLEIPCEGPEAWEMARILRGQAYELAGRYDRIAEDPGAGRWADVARLFAARTLHEAAAEYLRLFWECPCDHSRLTEEQCEMYRQGLAAHADDFLTWEAVDRYRGLLIGPERLGCCSRAAQLAREALEELDPQGFPPTVEILPDGDRLTPVLRPAGYAR